MNIWLNLCMWEMNRYEILTKFKGCFRQETMTFKYQARSDWLTAAMTTFDLGPNLVPPRVNAHNQSQSQCQQEEQPERAQCEEPAREREGRGGERNQNSGFWMYFRGQEFRYDDSAFLPRCFRTRSRPQTRETFLEMRFGRRV